MAVETADIIQQLITMSRELGAPAHDLAILGEGNTSARGERGQFWVKASGSTLGTIDADGFVALDQTATIALLDEDLLTDDAISAALTRVRVNGDRRPSVEAIMHGYLLSLPGINFVGHTHPTPVNAMLCSPQAEALSQVCLFPDQIVCCGPAPVFVPYTDPGLPLARAVRERVCAWIEAQGMLPKAILLQNHGLFALGRTPNEVISCSLMWAKTARVMLGALACGGLHPLSPEQVARIFTRPDEKFREQFLLGQRA